MTQAYADRAQLQELERVVLGTQGVVSLHPGLWGEAGTYLPGGVFTGLRCSQRGVRVHVAVDLSRPLKATADELRDRLLAVHHGPVDVIIEDVVNA